MKIAGGILGIIGGIWGFLGSILIAWVGTALQALGIMGGTVTTIGVVGIILSIVGIVGGGLAFGRPKAGGILMLIGSIGLIIVVAMGATAWYVILPMALLIVGGILALVGSRQAAPICLGREEKVVPILRGEKPMPEDMPVRCRNIIRSLMEEITNGGVERTVGAPRLQRSGDARTSRGNQRSTRRLEARKGLSLRQAHYQSPCLSSR